MGESDSGSTFTIRNSSIEFVVVGPKGKRDGVLVRSDNLRTDLIGFASSGNTPRDIGSGLMFRLFPVAARMMCSVESFPLDRTGHEWDERKSEYRFCWVGPCSKSERSTIQETFNRHVADLQAGIEEGDVGQVEWSVAPVVLDCTVAQARARKRWRVMVFTGAIYAMFGLGSFIAWAIRGVSH